MGCRVVVGIVALGCCSPAAYAAEFRDYPKQGVYVGAGIGDLVVDNHRLHGFTPEHVTLGYSLSQRLSIELMHVECDFDVGVLPQYGSVAQVDFSSTALLAAARTEGVYFLKGRAGWGTSEAAINIDDSTLADRYSDDGLIWGVGAGIRLSHLLLEADYTVLAADVDAWTFTAAYHF